MSTGGGGWSLPFGNPVKNYFSRIVISTRFKKYAPDSLVSVCVATMVGLIFILCSLGPLLIQVSFRRVPARRALRFLLITAARRSTELGLL